MFPCQALPMFKRGRNDTEEDREIHSILKTALFLLTVS